LPVEFEQPPLAPQLDVFPTIVVVITAITAVNINIISIVIIVVHHVHKAVLARLGNAHVSVWLATDLTGLSLAQYIMRQFERFTGGFRLIALSLFDVVAQDAPRIVDRERDARVCHDGPLHRGPNRVRDLSTNL